MMDKVHFHREALLINRMLTRDMEMKLFKQVQVIVKNNGTVLIKMAYRLTVLWIA